MKKVFSILLVLFLSLSFFACDDSNSTNKKDDKVEMVGSGSLTLKILHVNDTHAHLEASSTKLTALVTSDSTTRVKTGGYAAISSRISEVKEESTNTLVLHAGDAAAGTLYYTQFKGTADIKAMKKIGFDAMVLGNHEFDNGLEVVKGMVDEASTGEGAFPVLSSNVTVTTDSDLAEKILPYTIKEFGEEKVAIIGVTLENTPNISSPGSDFTFADEIETLKTTVETVKNEGVGIIIALTHCGTTMDKEIADEVSDIDVIVGGHSHSLYGNEFDDYGFTSQEDEYPIVVEKISKKTVIVTAGSNANFLGELTVVFSNYDVEAASGSTKLLILEDQDIQDDDKVDLAGDDLATFTTNVENSDVLDLVESDADIVDMIAPWSEDVAAFQTKKVTTEIAEALPHNRAPGASQYIGDNESAYTFGPTESSHMAHHSAAAEVWYVQKNGYADCKIGFANSGGVRRGLQQGTVTYGDIYQVHPFGNTLVVMTMTGAQVKAHVKEALEVASDPGENGSSGAFPYVAGIKYSAHVDSEDRYILDSVTLADGSAIDDSASYQAVTNSFSAAGGDSYTVLEGLGDDNKIDTGFVDAEAIISYFESKTSWSRLPQLIDWTPAD